MAAFLRLWQQLTTPVIEITDIERSQQANLLTSLSLVVVLASFISISLTLLYGSLVNIQEILPIILGHVLFLVPYYQSRYGLVQEATLSLSFIGVILITISIVFADVERGYDTLYYYALVTAFVMVFLPRVYVFFSLSLTILLMFLFANVNSSVELINIMRGPLAFNMVGTGFLFIFMTVWRRRESEKLQLIRLSEQHKAQLLLKREQYAILATSVEAISHDLRTRLSLIETNRYFIKRQLEQVEDNNESISRLDNIHNIIDDIDHQISNLNIVINLGNPQVEKIDINQLIDEVCTDMLPTAKKHTIQLVKHYAPEPLYINCHLNHIRSALSHLVKNAITYSPNGSTVILNVEQMGNYGCIMVEDKGTGINPDHLEHIFDIFYKTDNARTTSFAGLGLGLTIVKLIAEAYAGHIKVDSELGKGSTFTFCIPIATGDEIIQSVSNK